MGDAAPISPGAVPGSAEASRARRSDAARNERRLLEVAAATFEADGVDASPEHIAKLAGVGVGTLYRHFPTRRALLAAVIAEGFTALAERADELLAEPELEPGEALRTWLSAMVAAVSRFRGLPGQSAAIMAVEERVAAPCEVMHESVGRLVYRAKRAGVLRHDVSVEDLLLLSCSVAWAAEQVQGGGAYAERLLVLVLEGVEKTKR
ncbi:transcriptional regulator [Frankia sp. EI5c]|uniref:TetR/AcrR family transcriptional regulator n=1 Tax=Frankia sp. EI5c TaxID=683316 RepID=UPI0007C30F51|nr:TetR/AcrR family transcriptional regulator [Frankia sp. EI5c]OAA23898.1 transcriptional regulator [Frankia sp. EI5c]